MGEFSASGTGALALSGQSSAVVVSMGTGTAFLWASPDGIRHLCGSGIGGGTLGGLCHKLVGMERFGQIKKLAESGNLDHVDLTMKDITVHSAPTLDPDMTAANFGDLAEDATPADLAAGVVNLVLQAIGTMTVLACQCCDSKTVVLTGSMTTLPQAVTNFQLFEKLYGIHYIIPENATFATAIGAGLYSLQKKPEACGRLDGKLVPVSSGYSGIPPPSGGDAAHGPAAAGGHELRVRVHVLPPFCRVGALLPV